MSCFITYSTLSVIYILYICIKFLNKTNGQTCEKKSTASYIKKRNHTAGLCRCKRHLFVDPYGQKYSLHQYNYSIQDAKNNCRLTISTID